MTASAVRARIACLVVLAAGAALSLWPVFPAWAQAECEAGPSDACYLRLTLPAQAGKLGFYASQPPASPSAGLITRALPAGKAIRSDRQSPEAALVVIHGFRRDAGRSFAAGLAAAHAAGRLDRTLVLAPRFQVQAAQTDRCGSREDPKTGPEDAVWTCAGWVVGAVSTVPSSAGGRSISSYAALDALIAELPRAWPTLRQITVVGFSAGAQLLQHAIGLAADPPPGVRLRYLVADPGSWLYFDPVRPRPRPTSTGLAADWSACRPDGQGTARCEFDVVVPEAASCPGYDQWKFGLNGLPARFRRSAADVRERYKAAEVGYLEGALDTGTGRGSAHGLLDTSCAAMLQGPYRLERGLAWSAYERHTLKPEPERPLVVVPGCGHDVRCVLPSDAARSLVFPPSHSPATARP